MKSLTEELINTVVDNAVQRSSKSISEILISNINAYENTLNGTETEKYIVEFAIMSSAVQISQDIIKEALIELLLD